MASQPNIERIPEVAGPPAPKSWKEKLHSDVGIASRD